MRLSFGRAISSVIMGGYVIDIQSLLVRPGLKNVYGREQKLLRQVKSRIDAMLAQCIQGFPPALCTEGGDNYAACMKKG